MIKHAIQGFCGGLIALGLLPGCGQRDAGPQAEPPAQAAARMEAVFETAQPALKKQAEGAALALRKQEYAQAFVVLEVLKTETNLTVDQALRVHQSIQSLQQRLAEGVVRGDPNAIRAVEAIRSTQPK